MAEALTDRMQVAERLRAARAQAGLKQNQVARLLKMHRPTISEIEAGRRRVAAEELARFADLYRVSIEWLTRAEETGTDPAVELAARELVKLKPDDLNMVLKLLRTLRRPGGSP
jgi:transcriptional regulator with XRE-family HTH domain